MKNVTVAPITWIIKKFSDEEFLELYEQGLNDREIADELNVERTTARARRNKLGLPPNCRQGSYGRKKAPMPITAPLKTIEGVVYQPITRREKT
jgi:hypothetical protein